METNKVLSALSYFSVVFAGIIFPIVVYFVSDDSEVKSHAKKALLSHLIPLIPLPIIGVAILIGIVGGNDWIVLPFTFIGIGLIIILSIIVLIWNFIKGLKVLQKE